MWSFLVSFERTATDAQAIIPKLAMKFWNGAERVIYEYVLGGGHLYITGGQGPKFKPK